MCIVIRYISLWRAPKSRSEYTTTQHTRASRNIQPMTKLEYKLCISRIFFSSKLTVKPWTVHTIIALFCLFYIIFASKFCKNVQKTLNKEIFDQPWSEQHPNLGRNIENPCLLIKWSDLLMVSIKIPEQEKSCALMIPVFGWRVSLLNRRPNCSKFIFYLMLKARLFY